MKKTAMQLMIDQLEEQKKAVPAFTYGKGLEYAIQAAKLKLEMEREQIEEAYDEGYKDAEQDKQTCGFCVEKAQQKEALIELTENELTTDEDYKKDKE